MVLHFLQELKGSVGFAVLGKIFLGELIRIIEIVGLLLLPRNLFQALAGFVDARVIVFRLGAGYQVLQLLYIIDNLSFVVFFRYSGLKEQISCSAEAFLPQLLLNFLIQNITSIVYSERIVLVCNGSCPRTEREQHKDG